MFKFIDLNLYKWRAIYYDNLKNTMCAVGPKVKYFFSIVAPGIGKITFLNQIGSYLLGALILC